MKKKILFVIIVAVLLIALIGTGLFYFMKLGTSGVDQVESTSSDGFASLSATFFDDSVTQAQGGVTQALIGGTAKKTGIIFTMKANNPSTIVPLTLVTLVSPNTYMGTAFSNKGAFTPLATLPVSAVNTLVGTTGQSCTGVGDLTSCDTGEYCSTSAGNKCAISLDPLASANANTAKSVPFCVSLQGTFKNADGTDGTVTSTPVCIPDATGYDVRGEKCSDGTAINTCKATGTLNTLQLCKFTEGTIPSLITDCRGVDGVIGGGDDCGCATGYTCQTGGTCLQDKCADNTPVNSCSTVSHEGTYGAFYFCKTDKTYEARCQQCGATDDYYDNPKDSCSPATIGVLSHAVYQTYTGQLIGGLTEG